MMNFTTNELLLRDRLAEREREAKAVAQASRLSAASRSLQVSQRGVRAVLAARLARLALRSDRETAATLVTGELRTAGRG